MMRRRMLLAALLGSGGSLFPAYLTIGDNGQLGIDIFNYFTEKASQNFDGTYHYDYTPSTSEAVYISGNVSGRPVSNARIVIFTADIYEINRYLSINWEGKESYEAGTISAGGLVNCWNDDD